MTAASSDALLAAIACPSCQDRHAAPVRITAVSARQAARQSVPPQMIRVCPTCHALLVVTLYPAPEAMAS